MLGALGFDPVGLLVLGGVGAVLPWLLDGLRRKPRNQEDDSGMIVRIGAGRS